MLLPSTRSFPPGLPATDTVDAIADNDWAAFAGVEQLADHWSRPGWTAAKRVYYWMITFPGQATVHDLARRCQEALAGHDLDLIAADGLHITVLRVGDRELVRPDLLPRLVDAATALELPAFDLEVRPLAGSRGAVRFSVGPWGPLVDLHHALTRLGEELGVPGGRPTSGFRPHLGLGYNSAERPAGPLIQAVAALRGLPAVHTVATDVELVELRREPGRYVWKTLARVPLRLRP